MDIAKRLKELREKENLSQAELARRSGIAQSAISYIEAGDKTPGLQTLEDLAKGLDIDLLSFLKAEEHAQPFSKIPGIPVWDAWPPSDASGRLPLNAPTNFDRKVDFAVLVMEDLPYVLGILKDDYLLCARKSKASIGDLVILANKEGKFCNEVYNGNSEGEIVGQVLALWRPVVFSPLENLKMSQDQEWWKIVKSAMDANLSPDVLSFLIEGYKKIRQEKPKKK